MNQYINLTLENIDEAHICCAIGDTNTILNANALERLLK